MSAQAFEDTSAIVGGNADPKANLEAMWKDAERRFQERTQKALSSPASRITLDELLIKWQDRYDRENNSDSSARKAQTKRILHNVLYGIKLLGGIAAQGISLVRNAQKLSSID